VTSSTTDGNYSSAGHALHDVLDRVRISGQQSILNGWVEVLDAQPNTVAWAQRHAEVVGLYQALMEQVISLPAGDRARTRAETYAPAWYRAVVWQSNWQTPHERPSSVIDDSTLDHLGNVADILALRFPGTAPRLTGDAIGALRGALEDWLELLTGTDDVPQTTRDEIAGQIRHVFWLLDNTETFGAAPVLRATRSVLGRVTEAVAVQDPESNTAKTWRAKAGRLVVALTLITGVLTQTNLAIEAAGQTVENTVKVVSQIVRGEGDPAQSADTPALPPGNGSARVTPTTVAE
jgi:hypothetical protein